MSRKRHRSRNNRSDFHQAQRRRESEGLRNNANQQGRRAFTHAGGADLIPVVQPKKKPRRLRWNRACNPEEIFAIAVEIFGHRQLFPVPEEAPNEVAP